MRRELWIIFAIIFVNLLGFGIVIPLLPLYAVQYDASEPQIGLLFASYSLSQLLAAPVLGYLSDRYGRRPILLLSLLGTVASFAMLALANSLAMLFAARILDGLSGGNIPTARAYISDVTQPEERARAYGLIGAAFGLGFIFGPALGGLLGQVSLATPFWAAAGLAALALVMTGIWLPESHHHRTQAWINPWRELPRLMRRPLLGRLLLIDFFTWAAFSVYQTTFALFALHRFGWGAREMGYTLAGIGLIGAYIQGREVGRVVRRLGERQTFVWGMVLSALGLGAAAFAQQVALFVVCLGVASVGGALVSPTLVSMLSKTGTSAEGGRIQSVGSALESLGRTLGPVWGNGLLGLYGEGVAYLSAAVVLGLLAVAGARLPVPSDAAAEAQTRTQAPT